MPSRCPAASRPEGEDGATHRKASGPPAPTTSLTEDGRRVREVLELLPSRQPLHPASRPRPGRAPDDWAVPDEAVDDPGFAWTDWFGREAPLGRRDRLRRRRGHGGAGRGPTRAPTSSVRGVASRRGRRPRRVAEAGAATSGCTVDAVWSLEHLVAPGGWPSSGRFSPTRGTRSGTTSAGCHAGVRARSPRPGSRRAAPGGWPPTGRTTPSRWSRCWTPSPRLTAASCPAGRSDRSPSSSGRASPRAATITDLAYTRLTGSTAATAD